MCLFASVGCFLFASPIQERKLDQNALLELCSALGISEDSIIEETQKQWLRKNTQERWDMQELSAEKRSFVLDWGIQNGLFCAWKPKWTNYDKALILGATTFCMKNRLAYLKHLWIEGVRFNQIVFLTGDRPLNPAIEHMTDQCSNESEAARLIWQMADLPEEMRNLDVVWIAVPMKMVGSTLKRPNTEDTLLAWLETNPDPCSALFVSDQPFCGYQFAIIHTTLPNSFEFDVIGPSVDPKSHPLAAAITLDTVARWMYQDAIRCKFDLSSFRKKS